MEQLVKVMTEADLLILIHKAKTLRENNQIQQAFEIAKACFDEAPRRPEVLFLLGLLQLDSKNYFQAEKFLTTAIALDHNKGEYYLWLAKLLQLQGRQIEAEKILRKTIAISPDLYLAYELLGKSLIAQKKLPEALSIFQKGLEINPEYEKFHFNIAVLYHKMGKKPEAMAAYLHSLKLDPENPALLSNYGAVLAQDRQYNKAITFYEKALSVEPRHSGALANLAGTYIGLEDYEKAEKVIRKTLEADPNQPTMWRYLTESIQYQAPDNPDVLRIQHLLEKETSPESLVNYYFALGKIYLDCKEYDKSFDFYAKGNALRGREAVFNTENFKTHINLIIRLFDKSVYRKFTFAKKKLPDPIFIVGTPRCGKSLLEDLLAQQPHICSAGEVGFAENIAKLAKTELPKGNYPFWVKDFTPEHAKAMRKAYLRRLLQQASPDDRYVIDTLPGNFMYLGVLAMLFPGAKFIHCKREPLDACLLMYFKYFTQGHSYTNDFSKLGSYYQQYERVMTHWHQIVPRQILEVNYEEVVANPQKVLTDILDYLNINERHPIDLARLHHNEIGIYKHFEKYLSPLRKALIEPYSSQENVDLRGLYFNDLMNGAKYHFLQGDYAQSERLLEDLLAEVPNHAEALHLLGLNHYKNQHFQKAIHYFEKAIAILPHVSQIHHDLAKVYEATGDHLDADKALKNGQKFAKMKKQEKFILSKEMEATLLDAFSQGLSVYESYESRILLKAPGAIDLNPDSYLTRSWDRYFTDLSFGSFRNKIDEESTVWRMRTWHFLFKNMAFVDNLYRQKGNDIRVLDLGCATGYLRRFLEGNYSPNDNEKIYYWGVDIREDNLLTALKETDNIESGAKGNFIPSAFLLQDFKDPLPFKDNYFTDVVSFEAIKYLPVEQGRALLQEMHRVIKDTGRLYLSTSYSVDKPGFMETVPFEEIEWMLNQSGFEIIMRRGSQSTLQAISKNLTKEHVSFVNELLKVHPPEMVAAMITPLYPQCASQVTFVCKKKG